MEKGHRMPYHNFAFVVSVLAWLHISQGMPPPGPPQRLSVVSDVNNIGIQWEPPTETYGNVRNYIVSWTILPNATEVTNIVGGDVTMSIISVQNHLGCLFRIRVRAENDGGIGPFSVPKYTRIACGKDYDLFPGRNVTVTSPGFNTGHHIWPGVICIWKFKTLAKYSLEVNFAELELTERDSPNCWDTYIDISGNGRLCDENHLWQHKRTSLQSLQITLKSGEKAGGRGCLFTVKSVVLLPGSPTQIKLKTSDHAIMIRWEPPGENTLPITAYRIRYGVIAQMNQIRVTAGRNMRQFSINTDRFEGKLMTISLNALIGMEEGERSKTHFARAPCRHRLHLDGSNIVNITSPGYPRAYPSNIICTWYITSEINMTSSITYIDFRLEDTSFCSSDFVTFSFRDILEHECSRMVLPKTIETNAQYFTLTFVTDDRNEYAGFWIQITSKVNSQGTDETTLTTVKTHTNNIDDNGGNMMSSTPVDTVSTSHTLMSSSAIENGSKLLSSRAMPRTTEILTTARTVSNIKSYDLQNKFSQNITSISNLRTVSHKYIGSTTHEMSTNEKVSILEENVSSAFAMEYSTSVLNFSNSTPGHYSIDTESKDSRHNDTVLAVILSTSASAVLLIVSICFFWWRQRHGNMKVNIEPCSKYRVTNIELHDILETQHQQSRPCLHVSEDSAKSGLGTRKLATILEYPEDFMKKSKNKKWFERKRCYSFPFSFSARRRKIHREIQKSLKAFGFIEDKQSLERQLQRKHYLRRTNSF